ncbi:hypothetical protein PVAP13_6NG178503 [Panicum virgatum]|uniref:Uncharacterized protein n=1 Tax=Panicum virgatum TaxID=38727 RepID=A0A8T0QZ20_PANVG|nr:hypothetical protein PVAP13_6NG178503 [Panicum virgatum]
MLRRCLRPKLPSARSSLRELFVPQAKPHSSSWYRRVHILLLSSRGPRSSLVFFTRPSVNYLKVASPTPCLPVSSSCRCSRLFAWPPTTHHPCRRAKATPARRAALATARACSPAATRSPPQPPRRGRLMRPGRSGCLLPPRRAGRPTVLHQQASKSVMLFSWSE